MSDKKKITLAYIKNCKKRRQKITVLTAYDHPLASLVDQAGIDIVLVGDSLANVVLGLASTREVGMSEMIYHAKAVRRAIKKAFLIGDMPFESYQIDAGLAVGNARRFVEEAGCDAVKLEWFDQCLEATKAIVGEGIPVMGHVGLTPQTADKLGGLKVQGKEAGSARQIIRQAIDFEKAGCFSIVLECVPAQVAKIISERLTIPTIGIGAGKYCDGQVLVTYDLLGLLTGFQPRFVKRYAHLDKIILKALTKYRKDVLRGSFPGKKHSFEISKEELRSLKGSD
ncbi:MAG: 3-methyl-2-oxobutanoate hydroxymethyltransferase [Candidatus Omnitrophota bacterium]